MVPYFVDKTKSYYQVIVNCNNSKINFCFKYTDGSLPCGQDQTFLYIWRLKSKFTEGHV